MLRPAGMEREREREREAREGAIQAILDDNAMRLYEAFMKRKVWPQEEAVALVLQAWRRDKAQGRPGAKAKDGGLLSAIYVGVTDHTQATMPGTVSLTLSFGFCSLTTLLPSGTTIDNASMILVVAALQTDDPELMALVWTWEPYFEIAKADGPVNPRARRIFPKEAHETFANNITAQAPRCAAWYRRQFVN